VSVATVTQAGLVMGLMFGGTWILASIESKVGGASIIVDLMPFALVSAGGEHYTCGVTTAARVLLGSGGWGSGMGRRTIRTCQRWCRAD
jgi:hypothetical protein